MTPGIRKHCAGAPDPTGITGERVVAFVVGDPQLSAAALRAFLQRQRLEPYKMPLQFERLEALPRTASGKPLRSVLRERQALPTAARCWIA